MRLEGVWFRYPESPYALEDVDITLKEGEHVALVGPNGAGKSTLLHLMSGLSPPTKGKVTIGGTELTKKDAVNVRRKVGLLFQDPDDQIFMPTVWEDVAFGPINMGLPESDVRVAIAGVLAMSPPTLLLDEPTANLDPQGRRDLVNILRSIPQGFVLATHDLSVAFELTQRVIVLKKKVIYDGDFRGLVEDEAVLKEASLELPSFSRLMIKWREATGKDFRPPMSVQESLELLLKR
ncbi:MAG: ABC transporter ATP-binding protein [Methanomassiliicoccales archaeon]|jgi:cobalt/nickel transport system ATP-binding protein